MHIRRRLQNAVKPDVFAESVFAAPYEELWRGGIRGLVFDVDNTLAPYDCPEPEADVFLLFRKLQSIGFAICLLSNNNENRVKRLSAGLDSGVHVVVRARKPGRRGARRAMAMMGTDASSTALVGDQLFTDMWCGRRCGMFCVLVPPMSTRDELTVRLKRGAERWLLRGMKQESGRTVLELLLALALVISVAAAVIPGFASQDRRRLVQAARTLQSDLRYAQRMALIKATQTSVLFRQREGAYILRGLGANGREVQLPRDVSIYDVSSPTASQVIYTATGSTASPCTIVLMTDRYRLDVTVNLGAGRAEVKEPVRRSR